MCWSALCISLFLGVIFLFSIFHEPCPKIMWPTTVRSSQWSITQGHQPWQEQTLDGEAGETKTQQNNSGDDSRRLDRSRDPHILNLSYMVKAVVMRKTLTIECNRTRTKICTRFQVHCDWNTIIFIPLSTSALEQNHPCKVLVVQLIVTKILVKEQFHLWTHIQHQFSETVVRIPRMQSKLFGTFWIDCRGQRNKTIILPHTFQSGKVIKTCTFKTLLSLHKFMVIHEYEVF